MKNWISLCLLVCLTAFLSFPATYGRSAHRSSEDPVPGRSVILESLTVKSEILGKEVAYNVYLPEDYYGSTMKYPVLYLLHGYSDDETGWTQMGQVKAIADEAIQTHAAVPMIIVMPDAGVTWYVNSADGSQKYEDFFVEELMPHVEREYKVRVGKETTAVAGLSMGGYGSLVMSLRHPELFSCAGAFSAGVFTDEEIVRLEQKQWDNLLGMPYGNGLGGRARLEGSYKDYSPEAMIRQYKEKGKKVKFYIDCGDDDFLILGNMELHARMIQSEIPHEFRVRGGSHTWTYWRAALKTILPWISESFMRS